MIIKPGLACRRTGVTVADVSSAQLYQESSIVWKFVVREFHPKRTMRDVLTNLKETIKPQCTASHCIRERKGVVKRVLHFTCGCQKWELTETEKGFTQFLNLLVNNSLAMTVAIKDQSSFFCLFIFKPGKIDFH